jgi:small subunit ribosomal protein S18
MSTRRDSTQVAMFAGSPRPRVCPFHEDEAPAIDYKDIKMLRKYLSSYMKIVSKRRSGLCAKHQRQMARELKKARFMALVSFVPF